MSAGGHAGGGQAAAGAVEQAQGDVVVEAAGGDADAQAGAVEDGLDPALGLHVVGHGSTSSRWPSWSRLARRYSSLYGLGGISMGTRSTIDRP